MFCEIFSEQKSLRVGGAAVLVFSGTGKAFRYAAVVHGVRSRARR